MPTGDKVEPAEPNAIKFERFIFDLLPAARQAIVVEVDETRSVRAGEERAGRARDTPESVQAQMIAVALPSGCARRAARSRTDVAVEISPLFAQNAQEVAARIRPGLVVTQPQYFC